MKLQCVIALLLGMEVTALAAEATALVFYTEPPASYVNVLEVVSIASSNVAYSQAVLSNGRKEEIPRAGIVAVLALPPHPPVIVSATEANEAIQKIRGLEEKYPQYREKLDAALTAWNTALAYAKQNAAGRAGVPTSTKADPDLDVDGIRYHDVALLSFNGEEVGISHADGAATIPTTKLTSAQIAVLNATTRNVHITPSEIRPKQSPVPSSPSPRSPVTAPTVDTTADDGEIARLKAAVSATEANLKNLQSEQAALQIKVNTTPNSLRGSPEFQTATRRKNALVTEIQLAQIACGDATEKLRQTEEAAMRKALNATVEAYRAAAILPVDVSTWGALEKQWLGRLTVSVDSPTAEPDLLAAFEDKWSTEVTERTKSARAAADAALKAGPTARNTPEGKRLNLISDAEEKKLQIATETLKAIKTRLAATERQLQLEKQQMAEAQRQSAEAATIEKTTKQFRTLPVVTDRFVQAKSLFSDEPPSYTETIEFINSRLNSPFLAPTKIGFGEQLRKIIWRGDGFAYAFDPADLNADVKYSIGTGPGASNSIFLECRNRKGLIQCWTRSSVDPQVLFGFKIYTGDEIDTEKMAKAFAHLILMFGGKSDAF